MINKLKGSIPESWEGSRAFGSIIDNQKNEINTSIMLIGVEIEPGKEDEIINKIIDAIHSIEGAEQTYTEVYKKGTEQRMPRFLSKIFPINKLHLSDDR